jgi:hypothetical protein
MNNMLKRLRVASFSLGIIAACGLAYDLVLFAYLRPRVLHFEALSDQVEVLGLLTGLSLILIGLFHLFTVVTLLLQITVGKSTSFLKVLAGVIGVISALLLFSDLAMLQDIGNQYEMHWDTASEWTILFINHSLHVLFTFLAFLALSQKHKIGEPTGEAPVKDEVLFSTVHLTGLLCGGIGSIAVVLVLLAPLPVGIAQAISAPVGLLILLPYLLALGTWLILKYKERTTGWFDEKQLQDISRAGLWTLVLTIPVMSVFGILQRMSGPGSPWDFIWFPAYIFLSMLIFSSTTLIYFRR